MPARKTKTRFHLAYRKFRINRFPNGLLSHLPISRTEVRLVNTGEDYSKARGLGTSRVRRAMRQAILTQPYDAERQSYGPFKVVDLVRAGLSPAQVLVKASRLGRQA